MKADKEMTDKIKAKDRKEWNMLDYDLLKREVEELRKKGHQFMDGEISRADFKGFSGGLGCYAQREAGKFMIRLKTPSGIITKAHMKLMISYAEKYKLDKLHLTTRQAVQLHDLGIDEVCDIMKDGIDQGLFTRGGGGNFPRNVTLSPLAGVDREEVFDVTPYAVQVGNYFLERAASYHLPRKLKAAFSSSEEDTACASINDLGFAAVKKDGKPYFRLYLAGGMGSEPGVSILYPELIEPEKVLYYVEAMVNLFVAEGDYTNKRTARTRFIPRRMGMEAFLACYGEHVKSAEQACDFEELKPKLVSFQDWEPELSLRDVIIPQRQKGLYTLVIHPFCGQLSIEDAKKIEHYVSGIEHAEYRLSMNEDLYVRNLNSRELEKLMELTKKGNMLSMFGKTVTCIGVPSCQMGILQSQKLTEEIYKAMEAAKFEKDYLPRIQINGCQNSCSRHPVAVLGFAGRKRKLEGEMTDCFDLYVGGSVGRFAKLARLVGEIRADRIPEYLVKLACAVRDSGLPFEAFCLQEEFEALTRNYLLDLIK